MSLKRYISKRNFKKTSEPKGVPHKSKKRNLYIIQKHAASHLHYDFRLELNGVLLSWAVPKGPSLDPKVKRLAVHVEDHPVAYGSFEGIIPKGQYGGGTVMLWDKGEWFCDGPDPYKAYRQGSLSFHLKAKKLNGKWKLLRMHQDDKTWLLFKVKDKYASTVDITKESPLSVISNKTLEQISQAPTKIHKAKKNNKKKIRPAPFFQLAKSPLPQKINVQLATLVNTPPKGQNWVHEIKWDGYRLIAIKQGNQIKLYTRNHHDWTAKFNQIKQELANITEKNVILDGEIVVLDEHKHSNFQLLQNAIKNQDKDFIYYVFDLLYYDQYDVRELPLLTRKKILKDIIADLNHNIVHYSDHVSLDGKKVFKQACALGLEGIVSKESHSTYVPKRTHTWLKTKCIKRQEFIIGGFLKSTRRNYFRSLMLGTFDRAGHLNYNGNVGTGFTEASLKELHTLLRQHISDKMPFANRPPLSKQAIWLKPVLVAEVEFTEWTQGNTLRHPSFKGIRKDKPAKKIMRESPINIPKGENMRMKKHTLHTIITHPHKIMYPEDKIPKQAVADYYEQIQEWILPYIIKRPLTFVRCPENYKACFFQKHLIHTPPQGLHNILIQEKIGKKNYIYIEDWPGLLSIVQMGVLEIHPWNSQITRLEQPDILIFDLDPAPTVAWKRVVQAAFELRHCLQVLHLKSFVKTTGGKGLHVVVPIQPKYNWEQIKNFTHEIVNYLVLNNSKEYIGKMSKAERKNKIFIDYLRNQRGATAIAPYSTRARLHCPIATPIAWDELTNNSRDTFFTLKALPAHLEQLKKDPWKLFFKTKQAIDLKKIKF